MGSDSEKNREDSKKSYWESIIQEWKESGLKKKIFCEQSGLNFHTFCYWQARCLPEEPHLKKRFAKVEFQSLSEKKNDSLILIELPSQVKITIPQFFDSEQVITLLKILGGIHA